MDARDRSMGLTLAEELMLLALRDERGTLSASGLFNFIPGGALLAELLILGRVRVGDPRRKHFSLVDRAPTGDPVLDECLAKVAHARKPATLQTWVTRFAGVKRLKPRIALELCRKGVLRADEETVLVLFRRRVYPEIDPGPEREIVKRLRKAIFADTARVDPRTAALVVMAHRGGVLRNVFDGQDLKRRKERLTSLGKGQVVDRAVKEALDAVQAAATAAAVAVAAASS